MAESQSEIEVIVRGLVFHGERVLLCRSVKSKYCYLPGGHVEFGECAAAALAREFKEETGLEVVVQQCVLAQEHVFRQKGTLKHELNLVFRVELSGSMLLEEVPSLEPKIDFIWVSASELDEHDVCPASMVGWLRRAAARTPVLEWQSAISED